MDFVITSAGLTASQSAPDLNLRVSEFRVGAAYGFDPLVTDTDIHGDLLYTGVPSSRKLVAPGTTEFELIISEAAGDWQFGNVGLYLEDGTLLALGALHRQQWKIAYPNKDFNRFCITVRLVFVPGLVSVELVANTIVAGTVWELPSVDLLPRIPKPASNIYLCHSLDPNGNPALCIAGETKWGLSSYPSRINTGVVLSVSSTSSISSPVFATLPFIQDGLAVQFLNNGCASIVRKITGISNNTATLSSPVLDIKVGTRFEILSSQSGNDSDLAFFYSL